MSIVNRDFKRRINNMENENITEEVVKDETVDTQPEATPTEKTYTESELQKIVQDRVAREKKATEKAVEEAARLAKMNEDEKKQYEFEQLQAKLADFERKEARNQMAKEATKMLAEKGVTINDTLLDLVVKDDAESTKQSVDEFINLLNEQIEIGVQKALSGTAPKQTTSNVGSQMTKEQFRALSYPEKLKIYNTDEELYNALNN